MKMKAKLIYISIIALALSGTALGNISGGVSGDSTTNNAKDVAITVSGGNPMTIERYSVYTDAGAVAIDPETNQAVAVNSTGLPLDTSKVGIFNITYSATGSNGNTTAINRTVNIIDIQPPNDVTNLQVTGITWKSITIAWNIPNTAVYPNQDYAGIVLTVSTGTPLAPLAGYNKLSTGNVTNYTIDNLRAGTTYTILVQSADDQEPNHPGNGT